MNLSYLFIGIFLGASCAYCLAFFIYKNRFWLLNQQLKDRLAQWTKSEEVCNELRESNIQLRESLAKAEGKQHAELEALEEKLIFLQQAEERLLAGFKLSAQDALRLNQSSFFELAQGHFAQWQMKAEQSLDSKHQAMGAMLSPLKLALTEMDHKILDLEKTRQGAYSALTEQVKGLLSTQLRLEKETRSLVQALKSPQARGQWGEIQLRRVVEMAGMLPHVDFYEQVSFSQENKRLRPDMLVQMPNSRSIVVDAKVPLEAYLQAMESEDALSQKEALLRHAKQVKDRITELGSKGYWKELQESPEFVVLFLPAEPFLSAALNEDPSLLEWGSKQGVILATPSTLLALLKTIAHGWKQDTMAQEAKTIAALGKELYERIIIFAEHWGELQRGLDRACEAYNKALNSFEGRIMPSARKLKALHAASERPIPALHSIDASKLLDPKLPSAELRQVDGIDSKDQIKGCNNARRF